MSLKADDCRLLLEIRIKVSQFKIICLIQAMMGSELLAITVITILTIPSLMDSL
jgi:hypothetical protein